MSQTTSNKLTHPVEIRQKIWTSEIHNTAGRHVPYWYESFVGLIEVVKLLNRDEGADSVAFQVSNINAWDDMVVELSTGRRCYQVKYCRMAKGLTFGNLVEAKEESKPLLSKLSSGCRAQIEHVQIGEERIQFRRDRRLPTSSLLHL